MQDSRLQIMKEVSKNSEIMQIFYSSAQKKKEMIFMQLPSSLCMQNRFKMMHLPTFKKLSATVLFTGSQLLSLLLSLNKGVLYIMK